MNAVTGEVIAEAFFPMHETFEGKTIAQSAMETAILFARRFRVDVFSNPKIRVQAFHNKRRDVLDVQLSVKGSWLNPREGC